MLGASCTVRRGAGVGRTGLTRNQVCPCGHPGFESLPLRQYTLKNNNLIYSYHNSYHNYERLGTPEPPDSRRNFPRPTPALGGDDSIATACFAAAQADGIVLIGFPLRLIGDARSYPIVRYGIVARIQDWIQRTDTTLPTDPTTQGSNGSRYPARVRPGHSSCKPVSASRAPSRWGGSSVSAMPCSKSP